MRPVLLLLLLLLPRTVFAQGVATLVADTVQLNTEQQLIASGNIEVFFEGNRLTASQIIYDQSSDTFEITGPIFIESVDGTVLTATTATLDPRLENGILQGARIVLDQQLQLAANQIDRRDGRYSQLYKSAATSCRVCGTGPPLWEIRAERVVHDTVEQQLYFRNATFHVRGVPLIWLPAMRLPDPTLDRSTGLLVPQQRNTTQLGFGIKLPYFITLGDSRDLTVTPYFSSETRTLELRYRQAFLRGYIEATGAVSDDTLQPDNRSYIFAEGNFDLGSDYQLAFDIEAVSDAAYLLDYDYADKDRLDSAISVLRVTDRSLYQARFIYYQTLRDDESNASLPPIIADVSYEDHLAAAGSGLFKYRASADLAYRYSDTDGAAGRDLTRAGIAGAWQDSWVLPYGVVAQAEIGARADMFLVEDDTAFPQQDVRFVPSAGVTLRWPLGREGSLGTVHLLEPMVSLSWSAQGGGTPPNEDSTRTELDRANLLAISRYAGDDAVETGAQVAAGLTWTRFGSAGVTSSLSFGRLLREDHPTDFTPSSGLDELQSDWLVAGQLTAPGGFLFDARSLWDDTDGLRVADSRINWQNDTISLSAHYLWLGPDAAETRTVTTSEITLDAAFKLSEAWALDLDARYDAVTDEPVRAGIGLQWQNECVSIDVSASRRFTSSSTVEPSTTFGLSGTIGGFSTGRAAGGIATGCGN